MVLYHTHHLEATCQGVGHDSLFPSRFLLREIAALKARGWRAQKSIESGVVRGGDDNDSGDSEEREKKIPEAATPRLTVTVTAMATR